MKRFHFFICLQFAAIQILGASCPPPITPMPALAVPATVPPAEGACSAAPTPASVTGYLPITFVNNSGLPANEVYVVVLVNTLTQYLSFSTSGGHMLGTITDFTANTYLSSPLAPPLFPPRTSPQYTYTLDEFEYIGGYQYVFYIPNTGNSSVPGSPVMESSRILISLKQPLTYFIDNTAALLSPSEFDVKNDNYYVLNDKIEFDLGSNGLNRLTINLTGVDFFGLPLLLQADYQYFYGSSYFETCIATGMPSTVSLADVFNGYTSELTSLAPPYDTYWRGLLATYTNPLPPPNNCNLRIFAPATAMGSTQTQANPSPIAFPTNYFLDTVASPYTCTWFNAVWHNKTPQERPAFYQNKKPASPYLILSADTDKGTGIATGYEVSGGAFQFVVKGTGTKPNPDNGATVTFPKPTSSKAFFTGAVSDYEPPIQSSASAATNAQLLKGFATSIIAGFFPINCQANPAILIDQDYIQNHSSSYFQNNAILTSALEDCACVDNIPWYDFYSRALLTIGQPNLFYTSAYSDYLGTDGTMVITSLSDNNQTAKLAVYLGNCTTGINFPDPYSDTTTYTANIGIPSNSSGTQLANVSYSTTGEAGTYTPYISGTFSVAGNLFWIKVEYTSGVYDGQTYTVQVAPSIEVFHPILPGSGNIVTTGTTTTVYIGSSP